jgi:hypothetical protein
MILMTFYRGVRLRHAAGAKTRRNSPSAGMKPGQVAAPSASSQVSGGVRGGEDGVALYLVVVILGRRELLLFEAMTQVQLEVAHFASLASTHFSSSSSSLADPTMLISTLASFSLLADPSTVVSMLAQFSSSSASAPLAEVTMLVSMMGFPDLILTASSLLKALPSQVHVVLTRDPCQGSTQLAA